MLEDQASALRKSSPFRDVTLCGILGFSGRFGRSSLAAGWRAIAHRGPDDSGVYVNEAAGVGLGHARLPILDLSP